MDIKDFYNSVPYSDIEKFIRKVCTKIKNADTNYYLNLVTVDKKLPTGAPTSAHIANACFKKQKMKFEGSAIFTVWIFQGLWMI